MKDLNAKRVTKPESNVDNQTLRKPTLNQPSLNKPSLNKSALSKPVHVSENVSNKKELKLNAIKGFKVSKDPHIVENVSKVEKMTRDENIEKPRTIDKSITKKQSSSQSSFEKIDMEKDIALAKKQNDKQNVNAHKLQSKVSIQNDSNELLTVTDFYCFHYDLIKEIISHVLTKKYTNISDALDDMDIRLKIENETFNEVRDYIDMKGIQNLDYKIMSDYVKLVFAEAMGFGILEFLLNNKEVDEIIVQEHDNIQAEIHGQLKDTPYKFPSFDVALGVAKKIIRPLNKSLDVSNPNVDGQLPDGSRISATIPPLRAERQISMNIRKFSDKVEPLSFYASKYQSSTPEMVEFINALVAAKKTTIISGGTGSGKTTLINSLTYAINKEERIIVIEDTREIKCQIPRVEYYLVVPSNLEGYKGISISDIMQMCQRKRPDRIFVGECRGAELNEFLNAANTGHPGSITSLHSNNPKEAFSRMENMLQKNPDTRNMTHQAMQRILASSVDIIIQTQRLEDGCRRITHVSEVLGYGEDGFTKLKQMKLIKEGDECDPTRIYIKDIFYFKETKSREIEVDGEIKKKVDGQFLATGYVPYCIRELRRKGFQFNKEFFNKRVLLEV